MRIQKKIISILACSILLMSGQIYADKDELWKHHPDYISIKTTQSASFTHPSTLSVEQVARALSQFNVENSNNKIDHGLWGNSKENIQRLFTDNEIDILANKISQGLPHLSSKQLITFSVSDYRPTFLGRKRLSISGSVFLDQGQLNILLGDVHIDLQAQQNKSGVTGTYGRIKNTLSNGSFDLPTDKEWKLIPFNGSQKVNGRADWLAIDMSQNYDYRSNNHNAKTSKEKYYSDNQLADSNEELENRISKLEAKQRNNSNGGSSLESRLRKLKSLYEGGVLPESAYLEKVKSIMAEL